MSISTTTRKAGPFTGNGVTVSFPFAFKVFSVDDVKVVRGEIDTAAELELTRGTHYNVTLNSNQDTNPGGTVNWIGTPLSTAFTLVIGSKVASTQPATFTNLGRFYPRVLNDALDRLTIVVQQLAEEVSRSVKVGFSGLVSPDELVSTITTAASTASASAASAEASALTAFEVLTDAQTALDAANAATAGALQRSGGTMTGALTLAGNASADLGAVPKQQAETIASDAAASAVANRMQYSLTASQTTGSGTAVDFTGIPSWAKRITVMLAGVSTNGTSALTVQIGAGSVDTAGYAGGAGYTGTSSAAGVMTNGFATETVSGPGVVRHGHCVLTHAGGGVWVFSSVQGRSDTAFMHLAGGSKTLVGTLDRIRLTATNGTDNFDGGSATLLIEG